MSKTKKLIPELRFPEFEGSGEWQGKKLKNISKITMGSSPKSTFYNDNKVGMPLLQGNADINNRLSSPRIFTSEVTKECQIKDILLSVRAPVGTVAKSIHQACIGRGIAAIRAKKGYSQEFLYQWLVSFEPFWQNISQGGTFQAVNSADIKNLLLPIPVLLQEQQKIASCLSSLDDLIAAHNDKLEALKDHKKGLMQNLFPDPTSQSGLDPDSSKIPRYRFPEFENDGEWVEKKIISTINKGVKYGFSGGPFGSNLKASEYTKKGIRIIQLQNIGDGVFNDNYKIYTSIEKADELLSCNIYAGEIILSKMGDPVGRACIIPDKLTRSVMASDGIRLVVDEEKYSKYFIFSLINSKKIRKAIERRATGSTRKRIGLSELKKIQLLLPKHKKEQKRIATCLASVDELIAAQEEKIEQLQQHKKGLMQGLFPKNMN